jgi:hypothetical protein
MNDYTTYLLKYGRDYAMDRRRLYALRHKHDMKKLGSAGFYAAKILWML